ncbi:hypothetical protein EON63_02075 [archaeon]|nr:MAG: hypothetical protein EON63_02075 [archaeon]
MSGDSSRQIKQMVNFIMQEAHEKVNEIRIKVTKSRFYFFLDSGFDLVFLDLSRLTMISTSRSRTWCTMAS